MNPFEKKKLKCFTERTILLNKRFYWTNNFIEKTKEIDGKWTIIMKTNEINFFERLKKKLMKLVDHERWTNELKKV